MADHGYPSPENEDLRLVSLRRLNLLDTDNEIFFDDTVQDIVDALNVPIAIVSLVDDTRQWFKACIGLGVKETSREIAFCAHTIMTSNPLVINNALQHPLFSQNPLVTGPPHIRGYAGAPIIIEDGSAVGSVCAIDTNPHDWSPKDIGFLQRAARKVALFAEARLEHQLRQQRFDLEEAVQSLRHKEMSILSVMREGVCIVDQNGLITQANQAARDILCLTENDKSGQLIKDENWAPYYENGDRVPVEELPAMQAFSKGAVTDFVFRVNTRKGDQIWIDANACLIPDSGSDGDEGAQAVVTFVDITRRKAREQSLKVALKDAEAASIAKSAFVDAMSHEVRTPLNWIIGIVQNLLDESDADSETRGRLELLLRSGLHLKDLVDHALDLGQLDRQQLTLNSSRFHLASVLDDIAQCLQMSGLRSGLQFHPEIDESCRMDVMGDSTRLRQIIGNLLGNAFKFTREGSVRFNAKIAPADDGSLEFIAVVEDTGPGVAKEFEDQLFNRFTRAEQDEVVSAPGAGLGLHLARLLAKAMGGDIQYRANSPKGAIFTVNVKLQAAESGETGSIANNIVSPPEGLRVLLADDHPINQQVIKSLLSPFSLDIITVSDGLEAVEQFKVGSFDLLLIDIKMPKLDGYETIKAIRQVEAENGTSPTPILCLSAMFNEISLEKAMAAGANGYVAKPVVVPELLSAMQRVCDYA